MKKQFDNLVHPHPSLTLPLAMQRERIHSHPIYTHACILTGAYTRTPMGISPIDERSWKRRATRLLCTAISRVAIFHVAISKHLSNGNLQYSAIRPRFALPSINNTPLIALSNERHQLLPSGQRIKLRAAAGIYTRGRRPAASRLAASCGQISSPLRIWNRF